MGEDSGDKTEEPTPHKLKARKKGQIAKSQEMTSALMLIVSFYTFKFTGALMLERIAGHTSMVFNLLDLEFSSAMVGVLLLMDGLKTLFLALGPLLATVFIMVIVIESLQTGFLFSLEALTPKFENLNPINGFKNFLLSNNTLSFSNQS